MWSEGGSVCKTYDMVKGPLSVTCNKDNTPKLSKGLGWGGISQIGKEHYYNRYSIK